MKHTELRPAIFLDRDGTLIQDRGHLKDPSQVAFFPDTFAALRKLHDVFPLFIVTNQPGVAEGIIRFRDVERVNAYVFDRLREVGVTILRTYVCPHKRADRCECIKPNPHFLHQAAEEFGVDLKRSFVIGDHPHDIMVAQNVGARGIYVCTGHGLRHLHDLPDDVVVVSDIADAAEYALAPDPQRRGWKEEIRAAASIIREGGVVAFPTETVYGVGADAFNPCAVARIFEIKARPHFDPLIVHICDPADLAALVTYVPEPARLLAEHFWPGPLTLVLPKKNQVPDIVTAGLPTVAVRMPDHPFALELLCACRTPLAAPSANPFGYVSPTSARHVRSRIGHAVDLILDGGPCHVGIESTIVCFDGDSPWLLRPGGVALEEIEHLIGKVRPPPHPSDWPLAPGGLSQHYSPRTPMYVGRTLPAHLLGRRIGLLTLTKPKDVSEFAAVETLSASGDLREAAAQLYGAIRRLDDLQLDAILADPVPDHGLGLAINDRLRRAGVSETAAPPPHPSGSPSSLSHG